MPSYPLVCVGPGPHIPNEDGLVETVAFPPPSSLDVRCTGAACAWQDESLQKRSQSIIALLEALTVNLAFLDAPDDGENQVVQLTTQINMVIELLVEQLT